MHLTLYNNSKFDIKKDKSFLVNNNSFLHMSMRKRIIL